MLSNVLNGRPLCKDKHVRAFICEIGLNTKHGISNTFKLSKGLISRSDVNILEQYQIILIY